jgi:hypothetical protein
MNILLIMLWFSYIGIYHRTSEAGEESGSYVKGKNAGHVITNLCCASLKTSIFAIKNERFWELISLPL